MPPSGQGRRWSLALGLLAFAVVAPLSLVGLPFAALLLATRPTTRGEWLAAALAGGLSVALLLAPQGGGVLDAVTRAWIVLVSVAFAGNAAARRAGFWPPALRACLYAAAGVAVLGRVVAGPALWSEVQWAATRAASGAVRRAVEVAPPIYPAFEPAVRLLALGWPAWLVLETLAGLALAWRGYALVARRRLGPPLAASPAPLPGQGTPGAAPAGAVLNH